MSKKLFPYFILIEYQFLYQVHHNYNHNTQHSENVKEEHKVCIFSHDFHKCSYIRTLLNGPPLLPYTLFIVSVAAEGGAKGARAPPTLHWRGQSPSKIIFEWHHQLYLVSFAVYSFSVKSRVAFVTKKRLVYWLCLAWSTPVFEQGVIDRRPRENQALILQVITPCSEMVVWPHETIDTILTTLCEWSEISANPKGWRPS